MLVPYIDRLPTAPATSMISKPTAPSFVPVKTSCFHFFLKALIFTTVGLTVPLLTAQKLLVKPYVQPGNGSTLTDADVKVIAWMTDQVPADYRVRFQTPDGQPNWTTPVRQAITLSPTERYFTYAATLADLPFNTTVSYQVMLGEKTLREANFLTRKSSDQSIHFIVVGDIGNDSPEQRAIAYQMAQVDPEFLMICGDLVYQRGRLSQYLTNFWPIYSNSASSSPGVGAPLMQSVPFYPALGNHDVEKANLTELPDAFAAFYFFHPPRNAPAGPWTTEIPGPPDRVREFKQTATGAGYPHLSLYSFDNGPAHFLVLDSNQYAAATDPSYQAWIRQDLAQSTAKWKLVFFHHPPFSSSPKHAGHQKMRLLSPLFEAGGVDAVFSGHVHDYQRSKPLRFEPEHLFPANESGPIRGTFQFDDRFDGRTHTVPDGIVYVVTGAGGAGLYARPSSPAEAITLDPDAPKSFTAKFVADRHSFSVVDIEDDRLTLRQIDIVGREIDRIVISKPVP